MHLNFFFNSPNPHLVLVVGFFCVLFMMKLTSTVNAVVMVALFMVVVMVWKAESYQSRRSLTVGFYDRSCPSVEEIVRETVNRAVNRDPGLAPALIRMHFHDCFVRGCDASILLDATSPGERPEKLSPANNPSLQGFNVIDAAKSRLERLCPQTVSCADIIAFAARDSVYISSGGNIGYYVPSGRRDGTISVEAEVIQNIPAPTLNARQLEDNFAKKGLTVDEMVTLSGAHSVGISHCSSFSTRLYKFNSTHLQDPSMDEGFATFLKTRCPVSTAEPAGVGGRSNDPQVPFDTRYPARLDTRYYENLQTATGLLTSDQTLATSPLTSEFVSRNANNPRGWAERFAAAMVRLGYVDVLTGQKGQIRDNCRVVNRF